MPPSQLRIPKETRINHIEPNETRIYVPFIFSISKMLKHNYFSTTTAIYLTEPRIEGHLFSPGLGPSLLMQNKIKFIKKSQHCEDRLISPPTIPDNKLLVGDCQEIESLVLEWQVSQICDNGTHFTSDWFSCVLDKNVCNDSFKAYIYVQTLRNFI